MRTFATIILSLILLIAALLGIRALLQKNESAISTNTSNTPAQTKPTVTPLDPSRGGKDARITLVEFSDFQCPFCAEVNGTIEQLLREYPNDIRYVWKDFPNARIHKNSVTLHVAAACANAQGKFWEYHDRLFQNMNPVDPPDALITETAKNLGLNAITFTECQRNGRMKALVERNIAEGQALGVRVTPTFFINDKRYEGALSLSNFRAIITPLLSPSP